MASRGMEHLFAVKKTDSHGDLKGPSEPGLSCAAAPPEGVPMRLEMAPASQGSTCFESP